MCIRDSVKAFGRLIRQLIRGERRGTCKAVILPCFAEIEACLLYTSCELSVKGEPFLAASEAANPCDVSIIHKEKWQTMTFNVCGMGREEAVQKAFNILSDGGVVIEPIKEVPWSKCCATVIDKYGVCWWISI